jgi:hypothetical protein
MMPGQNIHGYSTSCVPNVQQFAYVQLRAFWFHHVRVCLYGRFFVLHTLIRGLWEKCSTGGCNKLWHVFFARTCVRATCLFPHINIWVGETFGSHDGESAIMRRPDDGGSKYLWNAGHFLRDYTARNHRRQSFEMFEPFGRFIWSWFIFVSFGDYTVLRTVISTRWKYNLCCGSNTNAFHFRVLL